MRLGNRSAGLITLPIGLAFIGFLWPVLWRAFPVAATVFLGISLSAVSSVFFLIIVYWSLPKTNTLFMTAIFSSLLGRILLGGVVLCFYLLYGAGLVPAFLCGFLGSYILFLSAEIWVLAAGKAFGGRRTGAGTITPAEKGFMVERHGGIRS